MTHIIESFELHWSPSRKGALLLTFSQKDAPPCLPKGQCQWKIGQGKELLLVQWPDDRSAKMIFLSNRKDRNDARETRQVFMDLLRSANELFLIPLSDEDEPRPVACWGATFHDDVDNSKT